VFGDEGADEFDEDDLWEFAEEMLPEGQARRYNLTLLDFGYSICTHSSPSCAECFASEYCDYYQNQADDGE
jgi:A/G-specific adenine glycosylase